MLESEKERLAHLEAHLAARVIGQSEAVAAVANAVRRSRAGLSGYTTWTSRKIRRCGAIARFRKAVGGVFLSRPPLSSFPSHQTDTTSGSIAKQTGIRIGT